MIRRWFILGVLLAVLLGLLWNFYTQVVAYDPMGALGRPAKASPEAALKAARYEPAWSKKIASKNLFSRSRSARPSAPVAPAAETPGAAVPAEIPPPELALSGIILNQFGEYIAYIKKDGGPVTRVRVNDVFDGVQVVDITPRRVTLMWNGKEIVLSMRQIKSKGKR